MKINISISELIEYSATNEFYNRDLYDFLMFLDNSVIIYYQDAAAVYGNYINDLLPEFTDYYLQLIEEFGTDQVIVTYCTDLPIGYLKFYKHVG